MEKSHRVIGLESVGDRQKDQYGLIGAIYT